jgi:hypothetical protein
VASALETFSAELDRHQRGQCVGTSGEPFLPVPASVARSEEDWL